MNLQRNSNTPQSWHCFWQICPLFFHNTCWSLCSKPGCLKERPGCSEDFPTELLSCLRSIQRRSSMRVRSPRSSPTYRLRFTLQSRARGSEVDSTRNCLGAGMRLVRNPPCLPLPTTTKKPLFPHFDLLRGYRCCAVAEGAIVWTGIQLVLLCYWIPLCSHGFILDRVPGECRQWDKKPVESVRMVSAVHSPEMKWWKALCSWMCFLSPARLLHKACLPIYHEKGGERDAYNVTSYLTSLSPRKSNQCWMTSKKKKPIWLSLIIHMQTKKRSLGLPRMLFMFPLY